MNEYELENFLAEKIAESVIYKLATIKTAAPKIMSNMARAAKPAAASPLGTKNNFMAAKANMATPTGKQITQNTIKQPTMSTPVVNDQLTASTTLQSAGFRPQMPIQVVNNAAVQGGYGMMNNGIVS